MRQYMWQNLALFNITLIKAAAFLMLAVTQSYSHAHMFVHFIKGDA